MPRRMKETWLCLLLLEFGVWGRGSRLAEISRFLEKDKRRKPDDDDDDDIDIVSLGGRSVVGRYATGGQILSGC